MRSKDRGSLAYRMGVLILSHGGLSVMRKKSVKRQMNHGELVLSGLICGTAEFYDQLLREEKEAQRPFDFSNGLDGVEYSVDLTRNAKSVK